MSQTLSIRPSEASSGLATLLGTKLGCPWGHPLPIPGPRPASPASSSAKIRRRAWLHFQGQGRSSWLPLVFLSLFPRGASVFTPAPHAALPGERLEAWMAVVLVLLGGPPQPPPSSAQDQLCPWVPSERSLVRGGGGEVCELVQRPCPLQRPPHPAVSLGGRLFPSLFRDRRERCWLVSGPSSADAGSPSFLRPVVQSLSRVRLFATPRTTARQASLSITISRSLLKLMSVKSVMPSSHLILCRLLLPSIFPSIRVFSKKSALCIRWPKYCSFSISPSSAYPGLILSF